MKTCLHADFLGFVKNTADASSLNSEHFYVGIMSEGGVEILMFAQSYALLASTVQFA